tara:strand:+ start:183 stop:815 length:633 start_codon:yes stop_codon:yes gene_type:complete
MSRGLLTEYFALCDGGVCPDYLTEAEKKRMAEGKTFYMTGKIQAADVPNGNGRIYPKKILEREMTNYQKLIATRRALGELDHPDSSVIELKNTSHLITEVWWEGDSVMGKLEVLNTPSGRTLKALAESACGIGISSRGLGSVKQRGKHVIVEDDFNLICFDVVSDPSAPGAFIKPVTGRTSYDGPIIGIGLAEERKGEKLHSLMNEILRK